MSRDLLLWAVEHLTKADIPHMLAGSFASTHHGSPRTTHDIDLIIDPFAGSIERFIAGVDHTDFYVDDPTVRDEVRRRGMFGILDLRSGWKLDLIVIKDRDFSRSEFRRRLAVRVLGVDVHVATAEDIVLAKLEWALKGGSARQLDDVVAVLAVRSDAIDNDYLDHWAPELGVGDLLQIVRDRLAR